MENNSVGEKDKKERKEDKILFKNYVSFFACLCMFIFLIRYVILHPFTEIPVLND